MPTSTSPTKGITRRDARGRIAASNGRPPGTRNRARTIADLLRRNVDEAAIGRIIQAMVEKAEAGDVKAAQFLFGPELARAQQVRLRASATDQPGAIATTTLQPTLSGEMTPEEAQRLVGVVETLVVGRRLDEMEAQLKAIDASGSVPMVTQAPDDQLPTWGRGLERARSRSTAEVGDMDEV